MRNDVGLMRKQAATTIHVESPSSFVDLYERAVTDVFSYLFDLHARSDGGVVMVLDTDPGEANVFELLPDGTVDRYLVAIDGWLTVLPDGSLIVGDNLELVRLVPPA